MVFEARGSQSAGFAPMNRAIFLDRDNTLIANDGDLGDPRKVALIRGAAAAIASLRGLGFKIVVVTNQGGVARGKYQEADVDAVNYRVAELVKQASGAAIDRFYYCPFHPEATVPQYKKEHPWRKPNPGMLLQAGKDMDIDLIHSWMIGDQSRDIAAGIAAGSRTIFITGDKPAPGAGHGGADFAARNLVEAARIIAQQPRVDITRPPPPPRKPAAPQAAPEAASASTPVPAPASVAPEASPAPAAAAVPQTVITPVDSPPAPAASAAPEEAPLFAAAAAESSAAAPAADSSANAHPQAVDTSPPSVEIAALSSATALDPGSDSVSNQESASGSSPLAAVNPAARRITIGFLQIASLAVVLSSFFHFAQPAAFLTWLGCALAIQLVTVAMIWTQPR